MVRVALLVLIASCGARTHVRRAPAGADDVTLYRDAAIVRQHVALDLEAGASVAKVMIAANVEIENVLVIDRDQLQIDGIHRALEIEAKPKPIIAPTREDIEEIEHAEPEVVPPVKATELRIDVIAPRAGHFTIELAYATDRIHWDAAYTMTATRSRETALLRGALAIRNNAGIAIHGARTRVVDAELRAWRHRLAEHLASALVGGTPSSSQPTAPREVGIVELIEGETRVELLPAETPRRMRSVLVYDPIGTKLDNSHELPNSEQMFGVQPAAATQLTESFEVERDTDASAGLPAGPVRLLERRPDGSIAVLGESRLFDPATRVADVDTIAVGTADGVIAHRERREFTYDPELRRLTEEFMITVDNARGHPANVLIREHLYRGQTWALAYPLDDPPTASKEGPQQIALRTTVPAEGQAKVLYVVVYTWRP
ncbi:MAG: hypothetical protein JWO36_6975 [Myxococcales bacterium]|nr:hypothetical protein [Myxococcales bacterium]